jgi:hypothetical protein
VRDRYTHPLDTICVGPPGPAAAQVIGEHESAAVGTGKASLAGPPPSIFPTYKRTLSGLPVMPAIDEVSADVGHSPQPGCLMLTDTSWRDYVVVGHSCLTLPAMH